jgi:NAD(P)-dependent dehydrogenase (short-subunit alcohol dehydrogenase family)
MKAFRMTQLTILTGASRGMGLAMAEQLCTPDHTLLCISRGSSPDLATIAQHKGTTLLQWQADLAQPEAVADKLKAWLQAQSASSFQAARLINNAGVIGHLGPIEQASANSLQQALAINLAAPMLLTQVFLHATRSWPAQRKVLQISSGLGRRAMAASAVYCATKAGLDHFSRCVALDEALLANPAQVVSLAPGVIDTDMQTDLRSSKSTGFPDQANFIHLKESGSLTSPADAAARVLGFLARGDFGSPVVADVRD